MVEARPLDLTPDGPLAEALAGQVEALRRLHRLLEEEYRILGERDPEPLLELARDKAESAERLAQLTAEGERLLAAAGLPPGRAGWQLWIQALPAAHRPRLEGLWADLVDGLEAVRRQNEVNGRTLELRRAATEQLLDALRGTPRDTYDPRSGTAGPASRTIAEA